MVSTQVKPNSLTNLRQSLLDSYDTVASSALTWNVAACLRSLSCIFAAFGYTYRIGVFGSV